MCKILTVINKDSKNNNLINRIIRANLDTIAEEKEGYSVFNGNTRFYIGDNAYNNIGTNLQYNGEPFYTIHSRTKTAGSEGIDGLHLQTIGEYVFSHNGTVTKYSGVTKKSDSYYFFKHFLRLYKEITPEAIEDWTQKTGFSGKAVLYKKSTDEFFFFCNIKAYITVLPEAMIISSYEPETTEKTGIIHDILGFKWYIDGTEKEIKGAKKVIEIDDMYLHFKDSKCIEQRKIDTRGISKAYTTYSYGANNEKFTEDELKKDGYTDEEINYILNPELDEDNRELNIKSQLSIYNN